MELTELSNLMREAGIAGAGGAGFPAYGKLNTAADTVILNCAECEPLLRLHRQVLARHADEILCALTVVADTLNAERILIAVKPTYTEAVKAVSAVLPQYPKASLSLLPEIYPAGDEVVTIYETTGRVVAPGALPISVGCIVYNVETMYNLARALRDGKPVTEKYVTVTGAVVSPVTVRVPLGMTYGELLPLAGGVTVPDYFIIGGGPMTGGIVSENDVVTKTSNAVLVLPKNHTVILKKTTKIKADTRRAMASCCQCRMCTDLCSRYLLGHPIEPHLFMRNINHTSAETQPPMPDTFYCSQCGLCEMFSCGQSLMPRSLIFDYRNKLRANGIRNDPSKAVLSAVHPDREHHTVPIDRLIARLDLQKYDVDAPLDEMLLRAGKVRLKLSQHIGVPATPVVKVGDTVKAGDVIAVPAEGKLSLPVHASIDGTVGEITDKAIVLVRKA